MRITAKHSTGILGGKTSTPKMISQVRIETG